MQGAPILALIGLLSLFTFATDESQSTATEPIGPSQQDASARPMPDAHIFLFHAVMEGLYRDGVANDVVDALTVMGDEVEWPRNFVWACPICMPCFNAFRSYRARVPFAGRKLERDNFGDGLSKELRARVLTGTPADQVAALDELTARWIAHRMQSLRLDKNQVNELTNRIEGMKKKGLELLRSYRKSDDLQKHYAAMESCPLCVGATRGAMGK